MNFVVNVVGQGCPPWASIAANSSNIYLSPSHGRKYPETLNHEAWRVYLYYNLPPTTTGPRLACPANRRKNTIRDLTVYYKVPTTGSHK